MLRFDVSGMTCGHCVAAVTNAVREVAGVSEVRVELEAGAVIVSGEPDEAAVRHAIAEEGYEVRAVSRTDAA